MELLQPGAVARYAPQPLVRVGLTYDGIDHGLRLPRQAIRLRRHRVGSPHVKRPIARTEMTLQGFLGGDGRNGGGQVRIGFLPLSIDRLNVSFGDLTDELTVVAIAESGSRSRIPQVEGFRFGDIAKAVEIRNKPAHITRH